MIDTVDLEDVINMDKLTNEVPNKVELEEMEDIWTKPEPSKPKRFTPAELWNIQRNKKPVNVYRK